MVIQDIWLHLKQSSHSLGYKTYFVFFSHYVVHFNFKYWGFALFNQGSDFKRSNTQQKNYHKAFEYFLVSILKRKFRPLCLFFPTANFLLTCQKDTSAPSMSDKVHSQPYKILINLIANVRRDKIQTHCGSESIYRSLETRVEWNRLSLSLSDTVSTGFITEECHLDKITSGPLFLLRPFSCVKLWLLSTGTTVVSVLDLFPSVSVLVDYSLTVNR